jgi:RPE1 domain-containing protein
MILVRLFIVILFISSGAMAKELLHASFDITRELFKEINASFIQEYGPGIKIHQSHGGSGKQTGAVMHGLRADVVSLALPYHMDLLKEKKIIADNWRDLFPNNSSPFSTHIVFLVRKNNPKQIKDWNDLIRPGIKVIIANPKTSGGALWNYVAAWIYANKTFTNRPLSKLSSVRGVEEESERRAAVYKDVHEDSSTKATSKSPTEVEFRKRSNENAKIKQYMHNLYHNAPILDSTARNAAVTFLKRHIGDVLVTWANEAEYIIANLDPNYEIIEPSISVKIDIPVAATLKSSNQKLADQYLNFFFSPKGQAIASKYYYHSFNAEIYAKNNIVNAEDYINWHEFKKEHFGKNGLFEEIYN